MAALWAEPEPKPIGLLFAAVDPKENSALKFNQWLKSVITGPQHTPKKSPARWRGCFG
jgi:hypothetical protein